MCWGDVRLKCSTLPSLRRCKMGTSLRRVHTARVPSGIDPTRSAADPSPARDALREWWLPPSPDQAPTPSLNRNPTHLICSICGRLGLSLTLPSQRLPILGYMASAGMHTARLQHDTNEITPSLKSILRLGRTRCSAGGIRIRTREPKKEPLASLEGMLRVDCSCSNHCFK